MKILEITPEYPPYNIGGGGIVVQSIAQALSAKEHAVVVVAGYHPTKSLLERVVSSHEDKTRIVWFPLIPTLRTSFHLKTVMPPNPVSFFHLFRFLCRYDFEIIHLHGFGHALIDIAAVFCMLLRKPYVITLHGFPHSPFKARHVVRLLYSAYAIVVGKIVLSNAEKITAVSPSVKKEASFYTSDNNRIVVIPNGLHLSKYRRHKNSGEFRRNQGLNSDDRLVVTLGALHWRKGFQCLIEALPSVRDSFPKAKLLIIGRNAGYKSHLQELSRRLDVEDSVVFLGFVDFKEKLLAMREAEIVVIPSLVEPFGLVALEAMALGKPIVASRVGGITENLENGETALLVEPGNKQELAKAMVQLLRDSRLKKTFSENAEIKAKEFDWNIIANAYLESYGELAGRHSG